MSAKVITGTVRASYVNVFQSRINELSGNEEYSMMILIPKSDKVTIKRLNNAIDQVKTAKWGKKIPPKLRNPLRDGDSENDIPESTSLGDEPYADHYFMNIKSKDQPQVVDKQRQEIIEQSGFLSGDFCRVSINAYAYDTKGNRGISFGLNNIQVLSKGEPLGGRTRAEDDFEEVKDEDYDFLGEAGVTMANTVIHLDFETYSEADIRKVGAWAYSKHPSTEVICMAYSIDGGYPKLWLPGDEIPFDSYSKNVFIAWNSFFEYCIWQHVLKWPGAPIGVWQDTAAQAAALALPWSLQGCGAVLGLSDDKKKDQRGKYLIQRLSKPNKGKRNEDPELLEEMYEYCIQDVVAEMEIASQLKPLSALENEVWKLDQQINARGLPIDTPSIKDAIAIFSKEWQNQFDDIQMLTGLDNSNSRNQFLEWLREYVLVDNVQATTLRDLLDDKELPPHVSDAIKLKLSLARTPVKKYESMLNKVTDGRIHGVLKYHGASTGRWASTGVNFQNLPRPSFDATDQCIELFEQRDPQLLGIIYDDCIDALASCIRGMVKSPEGKKFYVADYAAIEARVLAWLAGQEDILEVFRGHGKIYEHTASQIYGVSIDEIDKEQRFIGKTATLALGYQGGAVAFQNMANMFGVDIDPELADRVKTKWRRSNYKIVQYWLNIEKAALSAVKEPNTTFKYRDVCFRKIDKFLYCKLPSGRHLAYFRPHVDKGKFGKDQVCYFGNKGGQAGYVRQNTYGGKLVENITQAVARDIMAEAMLRVEQAGYEVVLSVHDELIAETDKGFGSVEEFGELMCVLPEWAKGMPVNADGFECERYRK